MKAEFFKKAEEYAECWSIDRKGKMEFTFSQEGLLLFALEICEQVEAMDNALVEALKS
jgi:hypothetical protein